MMRKKERRVGGSVKRGKWEIEDDFVDREEPIIEQENQEQEGILGRVFADEDFRKIEEVKGVGQEKERKRKRRR